VQGGKELEAKGMLRTLVGGCMAAALMVAGTASQAQETSDNRVAVKTDWNVFVDDNPTECWSVSKPKSSSATKGGSAVSVNRGDVLMFVSFRPASNVTGEISFSGGYEFRTGSTVKVDISGKSFELLVSGDTAWPASPSEDAKMIAAMKAGANAVVTGVSQRSGTTTKDTFSLQGFTAALSEAEKRCSS